MKTLRLFLMFALFSCLFGCGSKTASESKGEVKAIDDEAFYATQPLHSGLYDAESYDISGDNARKGKFDGRIYFTLSPELSAFYIYENGNRTKIDYMVSLQKPFEKGDSGVYYSVDAKNIPVTLTADSVYMLSFHKGGADVKIGFNPKPRHTGTALDILEKMNETIQKNKSK